MLKLWVKFSMLFFFWLVANKMTSSLIYKIAACKLCPINHYPFCFLTSIDISLPPWFHNNVTKSLGGVNELEETFVGGGYMAYENV